MEGERDRDRQTETQRERGRERALVCWYIVPHAAPSTNNEIDFRSWCHATKVSVRANPKTLAYIIL